MCRARRVGCCAVAICMRHLDCRLVSLSDVLGRIPCWTAATGGDKAQLFQRQQCWQILQVLSPGFPPGSNTQFSSLLLVALPSNGEFPPGSNTRCWAQFASFQSLAWCGSISSIMFSSMPPGSNTQFSSLPCQASCPASPQVSCRAWMWRLRASICVLQLQRFLKCTPQNTNPETISDKLDWVSRCQFQWRCPSVEILNAWSVQQ
jgi:hypothetical protein